MLGFILSKLNLLILVVALFAIIAYFMFSLGEIMKQNEAALMIERYTKEVSTMLTSATYCDRTVMHLPPYISVLGQRTFYYTLKVNEADDDLNSFNGNFLIFAVKSKADPEYIVAAASVRSFAKPHLFDWKEGYIGGELEEVDDARVGFEMDPQSAPLEENSFAIIKKVIEGKQHVFIIPCVKRPYVCTAEIENAFQEIIGEYAWSADWEYPVDLGEFQC